MASRSLLSIRNKEKVKQQDIWRKKHIPTKLQHSVMIGIQ